MSVWQMPILSENPKHLSFECCPWHYTVSLHQQIGGQITELIGPQSFEVDRIRENVLKNPLADMRQDYIDQLMELDMDIDLASHSFKKSSKHLKTLLKALPYVETSHIDLSSTLHALRDRMHSVDRLLEGSSSKAEVGEKDNLTLSYRLYFAANGLMGNSYGPTPCIWRVLKLPKNCLPSSNR